MKLISLSDAKAFLDKTDGTHDTLITAFIEGISKRFEVFLGRKLVSTSYTEYFNGGRNKYHVQGYPLSTSTVPAVTVSDSSYTEDSEYYVWYDEGIIEFVTAPTTTLPKQVKIVYTGGYVAVSGVLPVPDDLKYACKMQVAFAFQKRNEWGNKYTALPDGGQSFESSGDLLPEVKKILKGYRNIGGSRW